MRIVCDVGENLHQQIRGQVLQRPEIMSEFHPNRSTNPSKPSSMKTVHANTAENCKCYGVEWRDSV